MLQLARDESVVRPTEQCFLLLLLSQRAVAVVSTAELQTEVQSASLELGDPAAQALIYSFIVSVLKGADELSQVATEAQDIVPGICGWLLL